MGRAGKYAEFYQAPNKQMNKKQNTDWEKEFDKKFVVKSYGIDGKTFTEIIAEMDDGRILNRKAIPVKDFIRQTLANEKLELIEKIDKKLLKAFPPRDKTNVYALCALDVFLRILNELKGEIEGK